MADVTVVGLQNKNGRWSWNQAAESFEKRSSSCWHKDHIICLQDLASHLSPLHGHVFEIITAIFARGHGPYYRLLLIKHLALIRIHVLFITTLFC